MGDFFCLGVLGYKEFESTHIIVIAIDRFDNQLFEKESGNEMCKDSTSFQISEHSLHNNFIHSPIFFASSNGNSLAFTP
jgi:hypothetical protein